MNESDKKKGRVTPENLEEARRLRAIWDSEEGRKTRYVFGAVSQEAFGAVNDIGNQAAVGFFLNGKTALHSQADGLRVIAVLRGVMRGWEEL